MASILAVDDDPASLEFARLVLQGAGHRVRTARNGVEGLLAIEAEAPELVVSDLQMPELDGMGLLARVRQRWPGIPVIVVSVQEDVEIVVAAVRQGAHNYVLKPFTPEAILSAVDKALVSRGPAPAPVDPAATVLGQSPALVEVRHLVALAARCDVNVLITGETGTGKEVVSRAIHRAGPLADRPFLAHNCAATPAELFESHFFGHRKGSFTGATEDRIGLLEAADGGILFLDELSSMAPEHQAKLLRVIEDGEVRRVGDSESQRVRVRYIAAVNRPVEELIHGGRLREDLYWRLRGIEILLPPLRERTEDIPELARHFLSEGGSLTPEALAVLQRYPWPGNVRELKSTLESAQVFAGSAPIGPEHLRLRGPGTTPARSESPSPPRTLREIERDAIRRALEAAGGNRAQAARALGIDRTTLWRKLSAMEEDD